MREPARIDRITSLLNQVWKKYPDLRFFQLIIMIIAWNGVIQDLFYLEDDKLEKKLLIEIEKRGIKYES